MATYQAARQSQSECTLNNFEFPVRAAEWTRVLPSLSHELVNILYTNGKSWRRTYSDPIHSGALLADPGGFNTTVSHSHPLPGKNPIPRSAAKWKRVPVVWYKNASCYDPSLRPIKHPKQFRQALPASMKYLVQWFQVELQDYCFYVSKGIFPGIHQFQLTSLIQLHAQVVYVWHGLELTSNKLVSPSSLAWSITLLPFGNSSSMISMSSSTNRLTTLTSPFLAAASNASAISCLSSGLWTKHKDMLHSYSTIRTRRATCPFTPESGDLRSHAKKHGSLVGTREAIFLSAKIAGAPVYSLACIYIASSFMP